MWLYVIGWIIYLFMWSMIIGIAVWQISAQVDYNFSQKFLSTIKPARNWGPVDPIYRHCWVQWKKQYQVTGERDFTLRRRGTKDYTHSIKRGKHAAPPGTAYSVSPTSLDRTSSCYSIDGGRGSSHQRSSDKHSQQQQQQQQQQNLHQYHYNHAVADQRRWIAAEPKNTGGTSINYMWTEKRIVFIVCVLVILLWYVRILYFIYLYGNSSVWFVWFFLILAYRIIFVIFTYIIHIWTIFILRRVKRDTYYMLFVLFCFYLYSTKVFYITNIVCFNFIRDMHVILCRHKSHWITSIKYYQSLSKL